MENTVIRTEKLELVCPVEYKAFINWFNEHDEHYYCDLETFAGDSQTFYDWFDDEEPYNEVMSLYDNFLAAFKSKTGLDINVFYDYETNILYWEASNALQLTEAGKANKNLFN